MGGDYPGPYTEYNLAEDPVNAAYVFDNSPIPIKALGFTVGNTIKCGPANSLDPFENPFKRAFDLATGTGTVVAGHKTHEAWDPMTAMLAIFDNAPEWFVSVAGANGTNTVNTSTGSNTWTSTPGNTSYVGFTSGYTAANINVALSLLIDSVAIYP